MDLPVSLEELQTQLEHALPQYTFKLEKQLFGKTLLAKESNFRGARVALTKKKLVVSYGIPSVWGSAIAANFGLLGMWLPRVLVKGAMDPRDAIFDYLSSHYEQVKKG